MALRLFIVFLEFYGACEELLIQEAVLRFSLWFRYLFLLGNKVPPFGWNHIGCNCRSNSSAWHSSPVLICINKRLKVVFWRRLKNFVAPLDNLKIGITSFLKEHGLVTSCKALIIVEQSRTFWILGSCF
jgi:hypothetical protein